MSSPRPSEHEAGSGHRTGSYGRPRRGIAAVAHRGIERETLERLTEAVRTGDGQALVVRGDPGVGKTVLLDHLVDRVQGFHVVRVAGVPAETELEFAGLHQLCAPLSAHIAGLPGPQHAALATALGVATGPPPDHFLVGLAVLGLLSEVAGELPLLCIVDEEQWLDHASAQALGFVARRLGTIPVGMLVATRAPGDHLAGLPELEVEGLADGEARALLDSAFPGPLDECARALIIAEARGNPSALLELPHALTPFGLAGGFGLPCASPAGNRAEDGVHRQLAALPDEARRLLELAAADPSGDPVLVRRAAARLAIPYRAAAPAVEAGLVEFGAQVRFRHMEVRSATYRSASPEHRRDAHGALAEVTDPCTDPDRRAWHRGHAAAGPDEAIAGELERSTGRAQARGGLAAVAAFLECAVALTADPARHMDRVLGAARANVQAGAFGKALELLAIAEACARDERACAQVDLLRGEIAFASRLGSDAPSLLLTAARRLEPLDLDLARQTYANAWQAALLAGPSAGACYVLELARTLRARPPSRHPSRATELILAGLALYVTEGPAAAAPTLRRAVTALADGETVCEDGLRWGSMAAIALFDLDAGREITARQVRRARAVGALGQLPVDLTGLALHEAWGGDLERTAALVVEIDAITNITGTRIAPYAAMYLAALRGEEAEVVPLIDAASAVASVYGQGAANTYSHWVAAVLHNGHCHYTQALSAATHAAQDVHLSISRWALPELVEAAVRTGNTATAVDALARLAETTRAGDADFGLGLEARSRALVDGPASAEVDFGEAIVRFGRSAAHPDLARSHLLYGEWLRRENRRLDARGHLRIAHEMLNEMGMAAFAERARRELVATGESVRKRAPETPVALTSQEASIARLAAGGQTNAEIGAQLFLSARTIEWHLRKVFTKLGIASRRELRQGLRVAGRTMGPGDRSDH